MKRRLLVGLVISGLVLAGLMFNFRASLRHACLTGVLTWGGAEQRRWAVKSLQGEGSEAANEVLALALFDDDVDLRIEVTMYFGSQGTKARSVLPGIMKNLSEDSVALRQQSVWALGKIRGLGEESVKALRSCFDGDENPDVREYAAWALGKLGPRASGALPSLEKFLEESEGKEPSNLALAVRFAVSLIKDDAKSLVPYLIEATKLEERTDYSGNAVWALGYLGKDARSALPRLLELQRSGNKAMAAWAKDAIDNIHGVSEPY